MASIGAMDVMALSPSKLAARMIEDGKADQGLAKRYAGWQGGWGENYERADVAG